MRIDIGSENPVSNGTSTHPMLMVRLVCKLSIFSPHSWDACRWNDGEVGRPVLQEMFRENIKWQLERSWPVRSWRPLERSKLPSWQAKSVQYLQDIPRMARYEVTLLKHLHVYKEFCWPLVKFSETGPTQGTLRVFPDVLLSNAYIILRPFFSPTVPSNSKDIYDANNWKFGKSWYILMLQYPQ